MSDIFISYASDDRPRAEQLAEKLESLGWSVWWDRNIPAGRIYDEVIEEAHASARCVVVLWSALSIKSEWVRVEAGEGKNRNILIPVLISQVKQPLAFRLLQAANLIDWNGSVDDAGFSKMVQDISSIIGHPSGASRDEFPPTVSEVTQTALEESPEESYQKGLELYNAKQYEQAFPWFSKAADLGDAGAQFNLGVCYKDGQGVAQSDVDAVKWYRKAADQGDAWALEELKRLNK